MEKSGDLPKTAGVYRILNKVSGNFYVGSTINLQRRFYAHMSDLRLGKNTLILQRAYNKYGDGAFLFEVLEECEPTDRLKLEQFYMDKLQPKYNLSKFATHPNVTDEFRRKISEGMRKAFSPEEWREVCKRAAATRKLKGRVVSDEERNMHRERFKELWKSKEYRENRKNIKMNSKLTEDDVRSIKEQHIPFVVTYKQLAKKFGVSVGCINAIISKKNWKNV